ncbi:MAG: NAD(P)H-quinone oxidoreductase subunit 2, chloroplastic [Phycisphaerae bacterium]|nr:NAD(P)H-quinone oxidoreductase subunit 2, chloroplastic [Phycisphaerae bacterium]
MDAGQQISGLLIIGAVVPLLMFVLLAFLGPRLGKPFASFPAIFGILVSFGCAALALQRWWYVLTDDERVEAAASAYSWPWVVLGDIPIRFGVQLDSLTIAMYFMVTLVSSCIFIFSRGYMSGHSDEVDGVSKYHRFFAYLSLFAFSMLGLVISDSLLFLFIFWELVGLCSYLLIGYYFDRKYASNAAIKAFVVNRVGDFGFIIGLGLVALFLKDLSIGGAIAAFQSQSSGETGLFARDTAINLFGWYVRGDIVATLMGVFLFCGCIGKSAQVPLQVWLPDAMAGPTPVSALIHAATMVAAGVYLVARIFPLLTPGAQAVVAMVGGVTLILAALMAIVQTDIKKALAYSTLSQLGYMVFGMGMGAWVGALFHLITHAFFKAMLFLGSGQVIEGCHHEQDMRKMGGLWRKMPVTAFTFLVGVLAISGVGWPGKNTTPFFGLGGYYSKDEILAVAWFQTYGLSAASDGHHAGNFRERATDPLTNAHGYDSVILAGYSAEEGQHQTAHAGLETASGLKSDASLQPWIPKWLVWLAIITAWITPFYMMRVWWLTFMGKPRDEPVYHHAHESPGMYIPLVILAIGTFAASWFLFRGLIVDAAQHVAHISKLVVPLDGHEHLIHAFSGPALNKLVWPAFIVGFIAAFFIYRRGLKLAERIIDLPVVEQFYWILWQKFYFDEAYNKLVLAGTILFSRICGWFDKWVVDFVLVEGCARVVKGLAFFSGQRLDAGGIDQVAENLGRTAFRIGDLFRAVQTGRIRNYVIYTAATLAVVISVMVWW